VHYDYLVSPVAALTELAQEIQMNRIYPRSVALGVAFAALAACSDGYGANPNPVNPDLLPTTVFASGNIAVKVDEFRTLLGEPSNGGTAGEQATGRREITWDGAGANPFNNRNDFPANFFNTNVKSGAVFTTPGIGFRNDSLKFAEVNVEYENEFSAFTPTKIFTPVGSNVMDVLFLVAGQPTPARVTGFGAVFSDVDVAGATKIEFFDASGARLATIIAPVRTDAAGLSFAGARFTQAIVARVRITLGNGSLGAAAKDISGGGTADLVVADNFIYGEPARIQ
jgi:hypothetical protein